MITYRVREHNKHANQENKNYTNKNKIKNQKTKRNSEMRRNTNDTRRTRAYLLKRRRWWLVRRGIITKKRNILGYRHGEKEEKNEARQKKCTKSPGVGSNKASRLCSNAKPGILPHDRPSSPDSRRQRYQVSYCRFRAPPPWTNQRKPNKTTGIRGL